MKMVVAVIRPDRLQCVKDGLRDIGIRGVTITHVTGRGEGLGLQFTTRAGVITVDEIEKTKVEAVVEDEEVESVVKTIRANADTGHPGDGRIFILPCEASIRIRSDPPEERSGRKPITARATGRDPPKTTLAQRRGKEW